MVVVDYGLLLLLWGIVLLGNLSDWYTTGHFDVMIFSLLTGLFVFLYLLFAYSFSKAKIEVKEDSLLCDVNIFVLKSVFSFVFFSSASRFMHTKFGDIQNVYIGELGKAQEVIKNSGSSQALGFLSYYHDTTMSVAPNSLMFVPKWPVTKYMPVIFVQTKNLRDSFVISAKPFSRKGLRKFVSILKAKAVTVTTKSSWGLE